MSSIVLLALATVATGRPVSAAVVNSACEMFPGTDCGGDDVSNQPADTPERCCQLCTQTAGCTSFTHNQYNAHGQRQGTCYLKNGCAEKESCGTCTAGSVSPPSPPGPAPPPPPSLRPPLPSTPATIRAKAIVANMSVAEKVSILIGQHSSAYGDSDNGYYIGNTPAVPRLGVPSINSQDAAQGFRTIDPSMWGQVTSWPCSLGVASTWDVGLMERWGRALGAEFRAKGANMILGPSLNVHRVPLGGRNAEYMSGEDSYFGTQMVPAYVRGVQSQKVMANIKHFILNNQETNRGSVSANIGQRAMMELYMPPFAAGAGAGAASAMCSYNLINGTHSCGSDAVLNQMLKAQLNWTGFVTSDWEAVHADGYQNAGLDMDNPGDDGFFSLDKLQGNPVVLNDMATRVIAALISVDAFDNPICTGGKDCGPFLYEVNATNVTHAELARTVAAASAVLLKNDNGTLPIKPGTTVAVVGDCDWEYGPFSEWNTGNYYIMGGSGRVINPGSTSPLQGLMQRAGKSNVKITSKPAGADMIVTCGATTTTEGNDRSTLRVDQDLNIKNTVAAAEVPTVVVLQGPGALVTSSFDQQASAIVSMFLAGQATGLAWADVLFGDVNPSGRLPVTFPASEDDAIPPCANTQCEYSEGLAVGYRGLEGKPVGFPFGHGLSYTSFRFALVSTSPQLDCTSKFCICVSVTNVGKTPGSEVPQMYLTFPAVAGQPSAVLKGFARTAVLAPGKSQHITFNLTTADLSMWSVADNAFVSVIGNYSATVGASSRDPRVTVAFAVAD